jgi:GntR family transcriptional regulator, transcriptional repressor for pyruvate dehydrogenase complex
LSHPDALVTLAAAESASGAVRSPKTAELVAPTLRRMVVDGQLTEGDFLPHETELMAHFGISRPTLREAVRVLESERLVEVRRGSRTGARVRLPGPEIVARPGRAAARAFQRHPRVCLERTSRDRTSGSQTARRTRDGGRAQ